MKRGERNVSKRPSVRKKMSNSAIGKHCGSKNPKWKGDNVGYYALHSWVKRSFGAHKKCEHCGTVKAKRFEWANKSKKYKRKREDWIRLCSSCHHRMDDIGTRRAALKAWKTKRSRYGIKGHK